MLEKVMAYIAQYQLLPDQGTIVVGVSGGADSLCLLHVLNRICGPGKAYPRLSLHAAHLNHLLRGEESERDARAVADIARSWHIPCTVDSCDVLGLARTEKRSLEDAARLARYRFLRAVAQGAPIAVAHHADDQVETLLLHFLRGSGLSGMVGMQPRQQDVIRPLLSVTHAETLAYCREHHITPVEDYSNRDPRFARNRVRYELLPLLRELNPGIERTLSRNAEAARVDLAYLESQVDTIWEKVVISTQPAEIRFATRALLSLPLSLRRHSLRRATALLCDGQAPLELRHLLLLEHMLALAIEDRQERALALPQGLRALFRAGELFITRQSATPTHPAQVAGASEVYLPIPGEVAVPGTPWLVRAELVAVEAKSDLAQALEGENWPELWRLLGPPTSHTVYLDGTFADERLLVRTRRPGDRLQPLGMSAEKKVQDILVDRHITRGERATIPLVCSSVHCLWLAGICLDHRARLTSHTRRILRLSLSLSLSRKPGQAST